MTLAPQDLLDQAHLDDPHAFHRRLREAAPVWCVPGRDVVVVSSFDLIAEAVQRVVDFSSNMRALVHRDEEGLPALLPFGEGADALATADPPLHTAHRSAVFPELVGRRMATLRSDIEELTEHQLDLALASGSFDAMGTLANAIPIRVVSRLIGFQEEDPDRLLAAAFDSTAMLSAVDTLDGVLGALERTTEVIGWIVEQVQDAVDNGADGILGAIAAAVNAGELEPGAAHIIVHTLLSAGGESTTSLIGNAIYLLAADQALQDRVRADADLVTPFIEEALRLESPFGYHLRHAPRDTELGGVEIPAGAAVLLLWGAANRDPAVYDRPDEVVLDRPTPRHHLAFGRGIHHCVGAPLARLEADVVLRALLSRTGAFELDPDDPPQRVRSLMIHRFERLPIRIP